MKNSITIEGQTVELPQALIDQIKGVIDEAKKPKLPTWEEITKGNKWSASLEFEAVCDFCFEWPALLKTERSARKLATFNKLLAVADYLNEGWVPDYTISNPKYYLCILPSGLHFYTSFNVPNSGPYFKTKELAKRAIEIFKANGDEQELIDFYTK